MSGQWRFQPRAAPVSATTVPQSDYAQDSANANSAVAAQDVTGVANAIRAVSIDEAKADLVDLGVASAQQTQLVAQSALVTAYFDRPRITIITSSLDIAADGTATASLDVDLLRDSIRGIVAPGQAASTLVGFNMLRGITENIVETAAAPTSTASTVTVNTGISTAAVFQAAQSQGIAD